MAFGYVHAPSDDARAPERTRLAGLITGRAKLHGQLAPQAANRRFAIGLASPPLGGFCAHIGREKNNHDSRLDLIAMLSAGTRATLKTHLTVREQLRDRPTSGVRFPVHRHSSRRFWILGF